MSDGFGSLVHWARSWAIALAVCCLSLVLAGSASASKEITGYFGNASGTDSADGGFNTPRAVAVNATGAGGVTAGDVYVVDASNNRVQRFSAGGAFQAKFGTAGTGAGQLSTPTGVAVDPADGAVYIFDQGNRRVAKYTATGTFLLAFGAGVADGTTNALQTCTATCFAGLNSIVDGGFGTTTAAPSLAVAPPGAPNAGHLFVADPGGTTNRRIQDFTVPSPAGPAAFVAKVGANGTGNGQFGNNGPTRLAVDDAGRVYAVDPGNNRVQRFTTALVFDTIFAAAELSGSPSPADIAIDPGAVSAGDASDDRVEVVKPCTAALCPNATVTSERRVKELSTAGVLLDTHAAQSTLTSVNGLAVNTATDRLYLSSNDFGSPQTTAHRVWIVDDVPPPTADIGTVTDITAHGATLNGFVTPGGAPTGYHFEYSKNGVDWTPFPPSDVDAGSGTTPTAVSQAITGDVLDPKTLYHVRLVAKRTFGLGSDTSLETTFTTDPAGPTIGPVATASADDTGATLTARVNPNGEATSYRFEYGTTTAYGAETPDADAGDGNDSVSVSEEIDGLQPGTTYHYRLVASNETGSATGEDHVFTTRASPLATCPNADFRKGVAAHLPDCRAYEQVSPTDKGGFDVGNIRGGNPDAGGPTSPDGGAVAFQSFGAFAGTRWGGSATLYYVSRRDAGGWSTNALLPPPLETRGVVAGFVVSFTPDMTASILFSGAPLTNDTAANNNYYFKDDVTGALDLLAASPTTGQGTAASLDLSHLAFDSQTVLTTEPGQPGSTIRKVYEVADGQLRLVTRQPGDDAPFQVSANLGVSQSTEGAVSADGAHIFFTTPQSGNRQIYRRSNGTSTIVAAPSKRTPVDPAGSQGKLFHVATRDGNRVFFTSAERLTNDANPGSTGDLYRYEIAEDRLVAISASNALGGARVQGVVEIDDAGDRVYFTALGQVVPGQGADNQRNLYLWEDDGTAQGSIRYIATLAATDTANWSWTPNKTAQATPDGRSLVFRSVADVTGDNDTGSSQVYFYDADADAGAGALSCLSCGPDGDPSGSSTTVLKTNTGDLGARFPRSISDDGRRVVFSSQNPLLPRDTNGKYDAYMWEDGELFLLSSGTDPDNSYAFGASADGDDVLFRTREQLVPQDGDTLVDLYTAHVGGGFLSQQDEAPAGCQGDACQGPPVVAPPPVDAPSVDNRSLGNVKPAPDCSRFTRKARRLAAGAKRLRRKAAQVSGKRHSARLRRRSARMTKQARQQRAKAKRCTQRNGGAGK
jgi:hypothetical protein